MFYKGNVWAAWFLYIYVILSVTCLVLRNCRFLGLLHTSFCKNSAEAQRNMAVYILHLVTDTVLLGVWIGPLLANWCGCTDAVTSGKLIGIITIFVAASYTAELLWRLMLNALLLAHHISTILIIALLVGELAADVYQSSDIALLLALSALIEQPTFVALLLHRVLPAGSRHTVRAWAVAVVAWVVSKTLTLVLAIVLMVRHWEYLASWTRAFYIGMWALLYSIQLWSGFVQYKIYRGVLRKSRAKQQPSGAPCQLRTGIAKGEDLCVHVAEAGSSSIADSEEHIPV